MGHRVQKSRARAPYTAGRSVAWNGTLLPTTNRSYSSFVSSEFKIWFDFCVWFIRIRLWNAKRRLQGDHRMIARFLRLPYYSKTRLDRTLL